MSGAKGNILQVTPCMQVADVSRAVGFFVDLLGFTAVIVGSPTYAYVERDGAGVRILQASDPPGEQPGPGTRSFRYYFDVLDVDSVAEIAPRLALAGLPPGYGPLDQPYGQREYLVLAPDGDLVVFGAEIGQADAREDQG